MVNDRSTDNGPGVVAEFAAEDKRFRMLDNQFGKGVSGARNTGIAYAKGEWITFLDADDDMMPGAYEIYNRAIEAFPEAKMIQFNHLRCYSRWREEIKYINDVGKYEMPTPPDCWWGVWNKLLRADFAKDVKFEERVNYGEDGLYVLECMALGEPVWCAERDEVPIRHRFDNRQSLSHIKSSADVLKQIGFYKEFESRQTQPEMLEFLASEIGKLYERVEALKALGR